MFITKEYTIKDPNLPDSFDGVKIVHFSDLHYGRNITLKSIDRFVKEINFIKPDIVVFTGDLVETPNELNDNDFDILVEHLSKINARIGKYAILGDHDYEENVEILKSTLTDSGFDILLNESDAIYNNSMEKIMLYGVDDVLKDRANLDKTFEINNEDYKIVLVHEPDYVDNIDLNNYDLILAGHSHGGQVRLPLIGSIITPVGSKKYHNEYYNISGKPLYVSSGIGTSLMRLRLFEHPSFNFYRLSNK